VVRAEGQVGSFPSARHSGTKISMSGQETMQPEKKRRGPAPTGQGLPIQVRLQPTDLAALDAWIAAQGEPLTRPEAIRRILKAGLSIASP